jgi:hypothetical protein
VDLSHTAYGYQRHREDDTVLRSRLKEFAGQRKRFGSPRSFNGRLRDECLNTNWFLSVKHAGDYRELETGERIIIPSGRIAHWAV